MRTSGQHIRFIWYDRSRREEVASVSPQVSQDELAAARRWFAEELRHIARVRSPAVVQAFASVAREHFAGPGPWRLLSPWYLRE